MDDNFTQISPLYVNRVVNPTAPAYHLLSTADPVNAVAVCVEPFEIVSCDDVSPVIDSKSPRNFDGSRQESQSVLGFSTTEYESTVVGLTESQRLVDNIVKSQRTGDEIAYSESVINHQANREGHKTSAEIAKQILASNRKTLSFQPPVAASTLAIPDNSNDLEKFKHQSSYLSNNSGYEIPQYESMYPSSSSNYGNSSGEEGYKISEYKSMYGV